MMMTTVDEMARNAAKAVSDEDTTSNNDTENELDEAKNNTNNVELFMFDGNEVTNDNEHKMITTLLNRKDTNEDDVDIPEAIPSTDASIKPIETPSSFIVRSQDQASSNCNGDALVSNEAELQSRRPRLDSIEIYTQSIDFTDVGVDVCGSNSGVTLVESRISSLPALVKQETEQPKVESEDMIDNDITSEFNCTRHRGLSVDLFSFEFNDEDLLPSNKLMTADKCASSEFQPVGNVERNCIINEFDSKRKKRADSFFETFTNIHNFCRDEELPNFCMEKNVDITIDFAADNFEFQQSELDIISIEQCEESAEDDICVNSPNIFDSDRIYEGQVVEACSTSNEQPLQHIGSLCHNSPDRNLSSSIALAQQTNLSLTHEDLMQMINKGGRIGIYLPAARKARIAKFHSKRKLRIWKKRIKYDCRKKLADSRPRVKGRFVKSAEMDEDIL